MKVLHLLDSVPRGGKEILVLDICKNSKEFGIEVIVFIMGEGELYNDLIDSGVEVIKIRRQYAIDLNIILSLRRTIKEKKVDIVHSHQPVEGIHAYFATIGTKVKNVLSFHGYFPSKKNDIIVKFLIPRIDANIAVSKCFLNRLSKEARFETGSNFYVIHNGIDKIKLDWKNPSLKEELGLENSTTILGMVGNFNNRVRDPFTICKALPKIFSQYSNLHFIFVGKRSESHPEYYDNCVKYCSEKGILNKTHFLGARNDIGNVLHSIDVFVYASNYDSFGIAIVEAMMAGTPVVVNDLPPLLEITNEGRFASIYKTGDENALVKAVDNVLKDNNFIEFLKHKSKEWVMDNFSIENHIIKLKNLYKKVLKQN